MSTKTKSILASLMMMALLGNARAETIASVVPGNIRIWEGQGGVRSFGRAANAVFDTRCSNDPGTMWLNAPTEEARKAMLSILLTAHAGGGTVMVDYIISNGYCYAQNLYLE